MQYNNLSLNCSVMRQTAVEYGQCNTASVFHTTNVRRQPSVSGYPVKTALVPFDNLSRNANLKLLSVIICYLQSFLFTQFIFGRKTANIKQFVLLFSRYSFSRDINYRRASYFYFEQLFTCSFT